MGIEQNLNKKDEGTKKSNKEHMHHFIKFLKFEKTLFLLLTLTCSFYLSFAQENRTSYFRNYGYKDYNAREQNWDVIEGNNGILYLANNDGVLEYDGVSWRLIELPNQSVVRSLAKDIRGTIYVGGLNEFGYLSENNKGELVYVSLLDKTPKTMGLFNDIWKIKILDENVYFFSAKYLFKLENNHVTLIETDDNIFGIFSYNHEMYYQAKGKGLKKIHNDSILNIPFGDYFKDKNIWAFIKTKDHKIVGMDENNNFYTIDLSIKNISSAADFIHQSYYEISKQLKDLEVNNYTVFDDGSFGFASYSGFYHISESGKLIQKLNSKFGLLGDIIWNLYQDRSGILWLSTDNGISRVSVNSKLYYWSIIHGISSCPLDLIRIKNTLFIASFSGLQYLTNNQVIKSDLISNKCVIFLNFKNPENPFLPKWLISTIDEGIIEIDKDKKIKLFNIKAWKMMQSKIKPSIVYVGARDGLYIIEFKNSKWHSLGKIAGIDANIRSLFEDKNGTLWLGSYLKGVFKMEPTKKGMTSYKITQYGLKNNLPSLKNNFIFNLKEKLFFATNKGLMHFYEKQNRFIPDSLFGKAYCDGSRSINSLRVDSVNRVWIKGEEKGKSYFSVAIPNSKNSYTVSNVPFEIMNSADMDLLYVEPDSTIWFGSPEGLYKFKGEIPKGPESYPCYIRKVLLKKDSLIYFGENSYAKSNFEQNDPIIDYNLNLISFQFASPFFVSEDLTQYHTWLEGFDKDWSEWSNDTKIDYLNLKEGEYKFHVQSKNIYGKISDEDVFQFTIRPPWHRTWLAYTIYGILAIVFAWLLIRINSARLKRQNELLKQTVKERTANISKQKEKLQIQAEELKASNDKLNILNSTKDKFFAIISHDLKSPFNSILGFTNLLVEDYNNFDEAQKKKIINSLNKTAQSTYKLLENLLTWAKTQRGEIEINKKAFNLKELVETSIAPYKYSASQKKIEIVINILPDANISVDRNTSMRIIGNLTNNAIKFTPEGGTITISYHENGDSIEIHILDTGVGMTSEVIGKLFRIEKGISTKGTNNEKGTGLGLILCKEFINKNGGNISVKSEVGKGSEFIITFPK